MEFKCKHCNPNHDFLTAKKLSRHENTPSHKRKFDPEFAAAEQAEKAAKKAAEEVDAEAAKVAPQLLPLHQPPTRTP